MIDFFPQKTEKQDMNITMQIYLGQCLLVLILPGHYST